MSCIQLGKHGNLYSYKVGKSGKLWQSDFVKDRFSVLEISMIISNDLWLLLLSIGSIF